MLDLTRTDWRARPSNRALVRIDSVDRPGIELHHSVGIYGASNFTQFLQRVQRDHLGRGWTDGFYNVAVWFDGQIGELRGLQYKSNTIRHLTICLPGNYNSIVLTDAQKIGVLKVRQWLLSVNKRATDVTYHGARAQVGCPGSDVIDWVKAGLPPPVFDTEDDMSFTDKDRQLLDKVASDVADIKASIGSREGGVALDDLGRLRRDIRRIGASKNLPTKYGIEGWEIES